MTIRGRLGSAKIAILTVTPEEFNATQPIFQAGSNILGTPYFVDQVAPNHDYGFVLRQSTDRTNTPAGQAIGRFVEHLRPEFVLVVGTAGGIQGRDKVALGDVVVADYIEYAEFRKITPEGSLRRNVPYDQPSLVLRENFVMPLSREDWHHGIPVPHPLMTVAPGPLGTLRKHVMRVFGRGARGVILPGQGARPPKVIQGHIVSSDKIWGDPAHPDLARMIREFDKAVAFDTESFGVASEIFSQRRSVYYNPQYLVVRGISDFVNAKGGQATRELWTPRAAAAAGTFANQLVRMVLAAPAIL